MLLLGVGVNKAPSEALAKAPRGFCSRGDGDDSLPIGPDGGLTAEGPAESTREDQGGSLFEAILLVLCSKMRSRTRSSKSTTSILTGPAKRPRFLCSVRIQRGEDPRTTAMVRNLNGASARKARIKRSERCLRRISSCFSTSVVLQTAPSPRALRGERAHESCSIFDSKLLRLDSGFTFFYMPCKELLQGLLRMRKEGEKCEEHCNVPAGFAFVNFIQPLDLHKLLVMAAPSESTAKSRTLER